MLINIIGSKQTFNIKHEINRVLQISIAAMIFITIIQFVFSPEKFMERGIIAVLVINFIFSVSITTPATLLTSYIIHKFPRRFNLTLKAILMFVIVIAAMSFGILFGEILIYIMGLANTIFYLDLETFKNILFYSSLVALLAIIYYNLKEELELAYEDLRKKDQQKAELEILKARAELESLQSKINPHFLFNSLNSIAGLVSIDAKRAEDITLKLAELFRSVLKFKTDIFSSIEEEIYLIKTYLEIEKIRLGKRLHFDIKIDQELNKEKIPQLLLQPIVENAIKHGIEPVAEGGSVSIQITKGNEAISVSIEDNGAGFSGGISFGYGLTNVQKRLENLYGDTYEIFFESEKTTKVNIVIPSHS